MNQIRPILKFEQTLQLETPWGSGAGHLAINDQPLNGTWQAGSGSLRTCRYGHWVPQLTEAPPGVFALCLRNDGSQRLRLSRVDMACWPPESFNFRLDCGSFRELVHAGSASGSGVKGVGRPGPGLEHVEAGNMLAVYQHEDGQGLLLGVLPPLGPAFSEFRDLHDQPHMEGHFGFVVQHVFECDVEPGATVCTSPLVALAGADGVTLMQHYAGLWRQAAETAYGEAGLREQGPEPETRHGQTGAEPRVSGTAAGAAGPGQQGTERGERGPASWQQSEVSRGGGTDPAQHGPGSRPRPPDPAGQVPGLRQDASAVSRQAFATRARQAPSAQHASGSLTGELGTGEQAPEAVPQKPRATGWNSWDFYSGAVTREAMDENLDTGRRHFGDALQYLVIDEGWEQQWGSWQPNAKFGAGLEDFCAHVRSRGLTPGIWTAPLLVNTYNPLFLERPDWFASRADGQLQTDKYSYGPMAYLDVTRPGVLKWLAAQFHRLRQAGFGYFKVDFCQCILRAQRFHDARVGRADLIRRAFQTVRRAIGDDAYLLSCGAPYESVAGLADSVRLTGDIHIYWGHVLKGARSLTAHWWMPGALANGDPDFLVVRGPDTAAPPYGRRQVVNPAGREGGWVAGREFNAMEARTWALLVHLSAGDVILGDHLARLQPEALAWIRKVLQPRAQAAVPVDLFTSEQELPRIWISRGFKDTLVGLFNWSDHSARLDFHAADHGLSGVPQDFWTNAPVEQLPSRLPRRSSLALRYS